MRDIPFMYLVFLVLRLLGTAFFLSPCGFFLSTPCCGVNPHSFLYLLPRFLSSLAMPLQLFFWHMTHHTLDPDGKVLANVASLRNSRTLEFNEVDEALGNKTI